MFGTTLAVDPLVSILDFKVQASLIPELQRKKEWKEFA